MKKKTTTELQRQRISLLLRGQASIVRAEFLDATLPAALEEFDRRLQGGETITVEAIDLNDVVNTAVAQVQAREIGA